MKANTSPNPSGQHRHAQRMNPLETTATDVATMLLIPIVMAATIMAVVFVGLAAR